jgi:23S rRNA (uridine2552-2'-O)-methyltransferase
LPAPWRTHQTQDKYYRQAKSEGYRARSAYKLQEINRRFHLIRRGATVLDLGAAPGSWSQVALQLGAQVVAVDLSPIKPLDGAHFIRGDITRADCIAQIAATLPNGADSVISDVSPATSGITLVDHARSIQLARASLNIARQFLKSGGSFVVKVFQGEDLHKFVNETQRHFRDVRVYRPEASRRESSEHYVVAVGFEK